MDKLEQSLIAIQRSRAEFPDITNAYLNYTSKVKKGNKINAKYKALIMVALSLYAQCEMCISMNVDEALSEGATQEEIFESAMLAVSMGGGPKMMYMQYIYDAFDV
jgi:AhpD family alkylhydroperoxidase